MGSGKSYWGNKWALTSGFKFIDIDDLVEKQQGKSIGKIFEQYGEYYFRNLETNVLRSFKDAGNIIIATGGGTPCYNDNINWMNKNGTCVYLRSAPENILKRLVKEKVKRPLIKNLQDEELLFYIREKIKERDFFYRQANVVLDVDSLDEDYFPEFLKY